MFVYANQFGIISRLPVSMNLNLGKPLGRKKQGARRDVLVLGNMDDPQPRAARDPSFKEAHETTFSLPASRETGLICFKLRAVLVTESIANFSPVALLPGNSW